MASGAVECGHGRIAVHKRVYWILNAIDQRIGFLHLDAGRQKTFYYYLTDQAGSVMQVIREDGTVVNRYDDDAFGNAVAANTSEQVENRYRFLGRRLSPRRPGSKPKRRGEELKIVFPELTMGYDPVTNRQRYWNTIKSENH
jgi:hypothetical protein